MNTVSKYLLLCILIVLAGGFLRLQHLELRPMHSDESVNAVKFGNLLEKGTFTYDKDEYHGPLLYYMTLIPARASGISKLEDLDELHLRIVPVLAGMGLLLLVLFSGGLLERDSRLAITFIAAISPAMVFYSRYFIHEVLLVLCTYAFIYSAYLYVNNRKKKWLIATGVMLGCMHATKETFILSVGALILAIIVDRILWKDRPVTVIEIIRTGSWTHVLIFTGFFLLTSIVFYTSFFKNPQGIMDSMSTYGNYMSRAGANEIHGHPWYYYIGILAWSRGPGHIIWTEIPVMALSLYGMLTVFSKKVTTKTDRYSRILALFTLILFSLYSVIPYKTPWNMLTFYFGMIWMAGYGAVHLLRKVEKYWLKMLVNICLLVAAIYLLFQVYMTNTIYPAEPTNPYVYAHTCMDIYHMCSRIEEVTSNGTQGKDIYLQVLSPEHDYWPLPWYLRKYSNVGWWDHVDMETPLAPLIIASPVLEETLIDKMYRLPEPGERYLYVPLFDEGTELRPGVKINGYIRQDFRK